ncbi:MAG: uroporphyrinogen-III C-methyltransferase [Anaerolineaceae bacterium]|nr:uroporphyrinogen-III C-methyltransferase [Anaerolineaceae bacterium]
MNIGTVYLVGAGPGDPDLITRKGLRLIQTADVIVFDRLIPLDLMDEARSDAECINAGKAPTKHRLDQESINEVIVNRALVGKTVVRLKGGDPFVFGRGSEEALACRQAGVPFEVVPGVSSSYAVPAYAGIPLTHRHLSSGFTVITGHEDPTKPETSINYDAVAQMGGTIIIMMGVNKLPQILERLVQAGLPQDRPAAIIEWGSTPFQRVVEGTAQTLSDLAREHEIKSPATVVIGEVVQLRSQGVQWFDLVSTLASQNRTTQSAIWEE